MYNCNHLNSSSLNLPHLLSQDTNQHAENGVIDTNRHDTLPESIHLEPVQEVTTEVSPQLIDHH